MRRMGMSTRRDFLKIATGAGGIAFCGCELLDAARAQQPGRRTLPVTINGKRIKTIDVHSHCRFHEAVALMGQDANDVVSETRGAQDQFIVIEQRLESMDAMAI